MESKQIAVLERTPCAKPEHEEFARELATHGNALVAYRRAYTCKPESAKSNAYKVARHPDVVRRVAELQEQRRRELLAKTADLDALVSNMAVGKGAELFDENGDLVPVHLLPEHVKACISGLELELTTDRDGNVTRRYKVKLPDPIAAARLLAQLRGQLVERKDVTSAGRPLGELYDANAQPEDLQDAWRRKLGITIDAEVIEAPRVNNDDLL